MTTIDCIEAEQDSDEHNDDAKDFVHVAPSELRS